MTAPDAPSVTRSRIKLIAVFALFFGPLFLAVIWYYGLGAAYAPRGGTNHAPLVTPAQPLAAFSNPGINGGNGLDREALQDHWTIIHRIEERCEAACKTSLYNTRQTRLALGKDLSRIHRVLVVSDIGSAPQIQTEHPDLLIVRRVNAGLDDQLKPIVQLLQAAPDDAFLVDPLGNVMMLIPGTLDPSDLLKDLKKLMKLSKVG
jgi:cytochrome oxidase Cu insertion factor (SCO1/SenC/PrrC family)